MLIGARLAQFFQKTPASLSSRRVAARTHIINRRRHLGLGMSTSDSRQHTYIAAIDQGTSSTRVILYNALGENVVSHQVPLNLITPSPGWVEQDANEIIETIKQCMREVVKLASEHGFALSATNIRAIGVTNQRETTVVWDRISGKPLYNTIVWSDARTHKLVSELSEQHASSGGVDKYRTTTGLPISTYFSAIKLKWMLQNVPAVKAAVEAKTALFGTVDSWIIWNLTGGVNGGIHVTDVTNASRTLLMNLQTMKWDETIASELGIPIHVLPAIKSSAEVYGHVNVRDASEAFNGVPIAGCLGDQQAALVGQKCLTAGLAKSTYGTGCFVLYNTGKEIVQSQHGLLTTVGYQLGAHAPVYYALEGSISTAGSGIDWLRRCLELKETSRELFDLAATVPNSAGVCFVPSFNGLLAPRWRPDARGVIIGLSFSTKKAHIARALIESIAFQATDVLKAMEKDSGTTLSHVKVDGGLSNANLLLQIQADSLGAIVDRPTDIESTARGAAYAAGVATGLWSPTSDGPSMLDQPLTHFHPKIDNTIRARNQRRWDRAVERSLDWAHEGEYEDELQEAAN